MNAVIYARFSSHSQTEQSIDGQLRVCREYAEKNNLNIIGEYIDRALTGTNDNRPEFQRMIENAKKKEFEQILVYKLDRFSRNKYDNAIYKHKLAEYGVKVVSATEIISDTPEGAIMEGLLEMFAELYSKDLSQKVKRGIRESIIKGNYIGGHVLYGYKVVDKKIVVDEETAPAIRYLFEEYAAGKSKKQIVNELNAKGFRIKNKPITYNSFQNNLSNIKYTGIFDNGELQNDNYYPQIIDKELFDKVQTKLKEHKQAPATQKAKEEYLLTGKAFCGHCGSAMVGTSGTSKLGHKHKYYSCSKRWREHNCNKSNENKQELENYVFNEALNFILQPEQIELIANEMLKTWNSNESKQKLLDYEKQLARIENALDKCFDIFYKAESEELQKRINEKTKSLEIQKADIQKEIQTLKMAQAITHTKEEVIATLNVFLDGNKEDINFKKRVINSLINSIYIFDDKIVIYYNLFGEHKITFKEMQENLSENKSVLISNDMLRQNPEKGFFCEKWD